MKKDCVFLLADKQMEETFKGFLGRDNFYLRLSTRHFTYTTFAPPRSKGGDSGIFTYAHDFLERFRSDHHYAMVVLDHQYEGARLPIEIQEKIKSRLAGKGWVEENVEVIVIEPELEIWLWQDSPHIAQACRNFDYSPHPSLRKWLEHHGLWKLTDRKPADPKKAFEYLCHASRTPHSGALYRQISSRISIRGCIDPAFCLLQETLQRWFPRMEATNENC